MLRNFQLNSSWSLNYLYIFVVALLIQLTVFELKYFFLSHVIFPSSLYKNYFYKNHEPQISPKKVKNIIINSQAQIAFAVQQELDLIVICIGKIKNRLKIFKAQKSQGWGPILAIQMTLPPGLHRRAYLKLPGRPYTLLYVKRFYGKLNMRVLKFSDKVLY